MIALLAGSTTSPERRFPAHVLAKDSEEAGKQRHRERKEITTLLNALLSVGGSGAATWWAAEKAGWKNEWVSLTRPVLFCLKCNYLLVPGTNYYREFFYLSPLLS